MFVLIGIIYFGLYYQAGKNDPFVMSGGMMYAFFLIIIVCSAQFIALFFVRIRFELMKSTVEKHPFFFSLFSCGKVKDKDAFKQENSIG